MIIFLEGNVFVGRQEKNILLQGRKNLKRAINGECTYLSSSHSETLRDSNKCPKNLPSKI